MAEITNYDNGDSGIRSTMSDDLVTSFANAVKSGFSYIPDTYTAKSQFSLWFRIRVTKDPAPINPNSIHHEFAEYNQGARMFATDVTSFFKGLEQRIKAGYDYVAGTAKLAPGCYCCDLVTEAKPITPVEPDPVPEFETFSLDVALTIEDKGSLLAYCERFGIQLDKRGNVEKLKNQLKVKVK